MSTATLHRQEAGTLERRLAKLESEIVQLKDAMRAARGPRRATVDGGAASAGALPEPTSYLPSARSDESRALFRRAFAKFEADSPHLAIVLRWHAEGMTVEEIAALLERRPAATRQVLAEARKKVRAYLPEWQDLSWMTEVGIPTSAKTALGAVAAQEERPVASAGSNNDASFEPGGGHDGARARGEAAKLRWVRDGEVVPAQVVASAWGITPQALGAAARRDEAFALKVRNRLYYPRVFIELEREAVAVICRALGTLSASEKLVFFTRTHGSLQGQTIVAALASGEAAPKVFELARSWALERGAFRGAEKA